MKSPHHNNLNKESIKSKHLSVIILIAQACTQQRAIPFIFSFVFSRSLQLHSRLIVQKIKPACKLEQFSTSFYIYRRSICRRQKNLILTNDRNVLGHRKRPLENNRGFTWMRKCQDTIKSFTCDLSATRTIHKCANWFSSSLS